MSIIEFMEIKVVRRSVFIVEMRKGTDFFGYYSGGSNNGITNYDVDLLKAIVYKNSKGGEHALFKLKKMNSEEFSFRLIECIEECYTTFYDEYDEIKRGKLESRVYIRVKDKSDPLSEPGYLTEFHNNKAERMFDFSLDINNALYYCTTTAYSTVRNLLRLFGDKYDFYKERLYLKEERKLIIREN